MEEGYVTYKRNLQMRESWLNDLRNNLAMSENEYETDGELAFIKNLCSQVEEYLNRAYDSHNY